MKPMLSTVQLPKENMARFALFVLLDRIRGGHKEVIRIELERKLLLRSSCCRARGGISAGQCGWAGPHRNPDEPLRRSAVL